ncbi:MAG: DinB family protein [Gemmatimonadaceae bacterium]|nr:DinB family protein [Gemmatimonadaceae bacterium]
MTTAALHPRIAEVIGALADAQDEMSAALASVPAHLVNAQPSPGAWSVAQIVDHLAIVEDGSGRVVSKLIKMSGDVQEANTDPIGPTITRFQMWNPALRIEAPDMVVPSATADFAQATERQATARQRLIATLMEASGRAIGEHTFPHQVFGPLNGYQWALFIAEHQRRHLLQISTTLAALSS